MRIQWFRHGKWPKFLVTLHYYTIVSFILLVITGVALFWAPVHTVLIPYLPWILRIHILLGIVFTVTLLAPLTKLLPKGKPISRLDWWFPTVIGSAIVLTGILLWGVSIFPDSWRAPAFRWHGWFTIILGSWLIVHAFYKTLGLRYPSGSLTRRYEPERRQFLRWLGAGVGVTALVTVVDPLAILRSLVSDSPGIKPSEVAKGIPQFAEYYTVTGQYPAMKAEDYRLRVEGEVNAPQTLTLAQLEQVAKTSETVNFQCVTGWSVHNVRWSGVRIRDLARHVGMQSTAKYVHFYSFDGVYTECLTLAQADFPEVLLATHIDGYPLPVPQGYPVRLVVPDMYGYKSIKWVSRVVFSSKPITGYWEQRGYPTNAYFS
ncbi:MAG: molybdopterin-dependent oxidoreductase [Alicyclobacillaceae bacterium]|nr:molybdopterin-dependent oxidoreductase [Alicyclobacillaceae bacterium]